MASSLLSSGSLASTRFVVLSSSRSTVSGGGRRQVRSSTTTASHRNVSLPTSRVSSLHSERTLLTSNHHHGLACTQDLTTLFSSLSTLGNKTPSSRASNVGSSETRLGSSTRRFSSLSSIPSHGGSASSVGRIVSGSDSQDGCWDSWELFASALLAAAATGTFLLSSSTAAAAPSPPLITTDASGLHAPHIHIGSSRGSVGGGGGGSGGGGGGGKPQPSFPKVGGATSLDDSTRMETKSAITCGMNPKPYDVSVRALQGQRDHMEDMYHVTDGGRFAAVFDGHGGAGVSSYLRDTLHDLIGQLLRVKKWEENRDEHDRPSITSLAGAMRSAFEQVDQDVLANDKLQNQGSTAVVVVVHEDDDGHRTLLSGNVGDSRAILSRRGRAVDLTRDHKPNEDREKARILAMGETIEWDYFSKVHRIRNLSLSRAIGDRFAKPAVSGEVEIKHFPVVENGDEFVLLASDGLWDVMTSQEAVEFVHKLLEDLPPPGALTAEDIASLKYTRRKNMSRYVANEALRRGSADNVCVVIVWLQDARSPPKYA